MEKEADPTEFKIHCVLVGRVGVGKTALVRNLCGETFRETHEATIGVDFRIAREANTEFVLHDCSGLNRFLPIIQTYVKSGRLILLCYAVDDLESFEALESVYLPHVYMHDPDPTLLLVGLQNDKRRHPKIDDGKIGRLMREYKIVDHLTLSNLKERNLSALARVVSENERTREIRVPPADFQLSHDADVLDTLCSKSLCGTQ